MFDPRDPYERYHWHYDPKRPLSIAQIIASGSVDAETVALIWLLIEHGASLTVAGPTDPQPGVGKTTTVNALLQLLPESASLVYTSGMNEDFSFLSLPEVEPAMTYVLCNEVSDHSSIYMWGQVAQRYLRLPSQGYHIVTSVHADTISDVIHMYQHDLGLTPPEMARLGIVINIGLVEGHRRWFSTHVLSVSANTLVPLPLSTWNDAASCFQHIEPDRGQEALRQFQSVPDLSGLSGLSDFDEQRFTADLQQRITFLKELSRNDGVPMKHVEDVLRAFRQNKIAQ